MESWLVHYWPIILSIGGVIAGVCAFIRSLLTISKLRLEIEHLRQRAERAERRIKTPSADEIKRFGQSPSTVVSPQALAIARRQVEEEEEAQKTDYDEGFTA
jgi:hypothetical protein